MIHLSGHVNYQLNDMVYSSLELNVFSTTDSGDRLPFDFEGLDLVNFGNSHSNFGTGNLKILSLAIISIRKTEMLRTV
jgi:hypothetical protein